MESPGSIGRTADPLGSAMRGDWSQHFAHRWQNGGRDVMAAVVTAAGWAGSPALGHAGDPDTQ